MKRHEKERLIQFLDKTKVEGKDREFAIDIVSGFLSHVVKPKEEIDKELERLLDYIKEEGLLRKTQKPAVSHRRFYLFYYMRYNMKFKMEETAKFFEMKDHSSVVHGLKAHSTFMETKDSKYKQTTSKERKYFKL